jgi:Holliday junction resolvase RusA-like endonuclease
MLLHAEIEQVVAFTVLHLTPPSVNHHTETCFYRGKDGASHRGKKLTAEARAFNDAVAIFARGRTVAPATTAERRKVKYEVRMDIYLGPNQRLDADNGAKVGIDALVKCGVIHSDAYVAPFIVSTHKDQRTNPRTEYCVTRLEPK